MQTWIKDVSTHYQTTNFRLVQIADDILKYMSNEKKRAIQGRKHYEKWRNFSFSHNVFYSYMYISLERQNAALCGNGLSPYLPEYLNLNLI